MTQLEKIKLKKVGGIKLTGWWAVREMIRCKRCGVTFAVDDYAVKCVCGKKLVYKGAGNGNDIGTR